MPDNVNRSSDSDGRGSPLGRRSTPDCEHRPVGDHRLCLHEPPEFGRANSTRCCDAGRPIKIQHSNFHELRLQSHSRGTRFLLQTMPAKFKCFHVLGTETCPYCVMLKGALMMHLHTVSPAKLDKYVCYHDRNSEEGRQSFYDEVGSVVPKSHTGIPCVVAEFKDGSLMYIGGLDKFVAKLGCPMK